MMTTHAPIEAGVRQATALHGQCCDVDSYLVQKPFSGLSKSEPVCAPSHVATLLETVESKYAQFAGKMVIANASFSQRRLTRAGANPHSAGSECHSHQTFK